MLFVDLIVERNNSAFWNFSFILLEWKQKTKIKPYAWINESAKCVYKKFRKRMKK